MYGYVEGRERDMYSCIHVFMWLIAMLKPLTLLYLTNSYNLYTLSLSFPTALFYTRSVDPGEGEDLH